ncbi:MAG: hypothetical protein U0Z53_24935 [Blastocatellia bacterium]
MSFLTRKVHYFFFLVAVLTVMAVMTPVVSAQSQVTVVNAASYASDLKVTPGSIAVAFGAFKTQNDQNYSATSTPLPVTLGGVSVNVGGAAAALFFVGKTQINFLVPATAAAGNATITVTSSDGSTQSGTFTITQAAPGIFSALSDGKGTAAALTTFDGVAYQLTANADGSPRDVDAGIRTRPNYLVLYATGIRTTPAANPNDGNGVAESVRVTIQGVPCEVPYAGPQGGFAGLDQVNVTIPPGLVGFGSVIVQLTANGVAANPVTIKIGGVIPIVSTQAIAAGQTINGSLTITDQIQKGPAGSTGSYFFDAFRFTAAANTSVLLDMRSSQVDATILLYKVESGGALTYVAADDQFGGLGNGRGENNNALLLTVLTQASDYLIFATTADVNPNGVGDYTLTFRTGVITPISYAANPISAGINTTDIQTSAGDYLDAYWFQGAQGDNVRITMTSTATGFDSALFLNKRSGDRLQYDDNSAGGFNAQITQTLPEAGVYIIIATPFEPNRAGAYSLTVAKLNGAPAELANGGNETMQTLPARTGAENNFGRGSNFARFALRRIVGPDEQQ